MHKFLKRLNTPAPWWAWLLAVILIPASITATPVLYTGSISVPTGGTFSSKATVVAYNNVQFRDTSNAAVTANGDLVLGLAGNAQGAPYFGCAGSAQNCTLNFYANGTGSVANEVFTPSSAYVINGAQWRATPGNTLNLSGDFVAGVSSANQEFVGCTGTANPCTVAFYTNGTGSTSTASISGSNGAIFSASLAASQCVGTTAGSVLATTGSACLASNVDNNFSTVETALYLQSKANNTTAAVVPPCYTAAGATCTNTAFFVTSGDVVTTINANCSTNTLCTLATPSVALAGAAASGSNVVDCWANQDGVTSTLGVTVQGSVSAGGSAIGITVRNVSGSTITSGTSFAWQVTCLKFT